MNEIRDENHWTNPRTGIRYKAVDEKSCDGCIGCRTTEGSPACDVISRTDHRSIIWVLDDQSEASPDHLLRLRPPVDARTLEQTLHGLRIDRLCSHKSIDLTVTVEDGDIVVREAAQ